MCGGRPAWRKGDRCGDRRTYLTKGCPPLPGMTRNSQTFSCPGTLNGPARWLLPPSTHFFEIFLSRYISNESGRDEIYVRPFPSSSGKWQISTEGGSEHLWARNGRELFYRSGDKVMAVRITTEPTFSAGTPGLLFEGPNYINGLNMRYYDISLDGQRFLMLKATEQQEAATQINVVLNWFEELKQRVPTGNN